jgi:hypothetical protein
MSNITIETANLIPALANMPGFDPESRVWVYVSDRRLSDEETAFVQNKLVEFARQWTSHNQALPATGEVFDNRILLLMADETQTSAGGCSIDKSTHFLEQLGRHIGADFFERMMFFYVDAEGNIQAADKAAFAQAVENGDITQETLVLNTLVQRKKEFEGKWLVPFGKSWHKRLF